MVTVLRLGHRRGRDDRISSHVGLTARQFGAEKIVYSGEHDKNMLSSVRDLAERWGGAFTVKYREDWRTVINDWEGAIVHLTMYGIPVQDRIDTIRDQTMADDLLVVVGGEKVPHDVFDLADHNIAVGNQPHSEVAAVAVFLHEFFGGEELERGFPDADIEIVPQENGKKTREH